MLSDIRIDIAIALVVMHTCVEACDRTYFRLVALSRQSVQWRVLSVLWACLTLHRLRKWSNSSGSVLGLCTLIKECPSSRSKLPSSLSCSEQLEIWPSCALKPVPCLSIAQGWRRQGSPDPVPIAAATRWPVPQTFDSADQEIHPQDSHKTWTHRRWRWIGKCQQCESTACSAWAHGAAPPRLVGWLVGRDSTPCARSARTSGRFLGYAFSEAA